ncbi:MAG: amino acid adenylation domain-containing protein, partial [Pseudomonadota bacterium]
MTAYRFRGAVKKKDCAKLNLSIETIKAQLHTLWQADLQLDAIDGDSSYFKLGGSSITAIRLLNTLNETYKVALDLGILFTYPSINKLANFLTTEATARTSIVLKPVRLTTAQAHVLTFGQQQQLFLYELDRSSYVYHLPICFELCPRVDLSKLKHAILALLTRQTVLRTCFKKTKTGTYYQQLCDVPQTVAYHELTHRTEFDEGLREAYHKPFNLQDELPLRVGIYKVEQRRYLSFVIHHIAFDGWSRDVLIDELTHYYHDVNQCQPLAVTVQDVACWQRRHWSEDRERHIRFWQSYLDGYEPLTISTDYPRSTSLYTAGAAHDIQLSKPLSRQLRKLSFAMDSSLYSVLLSGFMVLLGRYAGQEDVLIGTLMNSRTEKAMEAMMGFFVNSLPIRVCCHPEGNIGDMIGEVTKIAGEIYSHQHVPLEELLDVCHVSRDLSQHGLFQHLFSVQSFGQLHATNDALLKRYYQQAQPENDEVARFELTCLWDDRAEQLRCCINYATDLFKAETIVRLGQHYVYLLEQFVTFPEKCLKDYQFVTAEDYQRIIYQWNETDKPYPKDKTIHALFEAQVKKTPAHIAVVYEDKQLTYRALNQKSNQLARYIRKTYKQVTKRMLQADTLIALCVDRSLEMMIGILGVLKSGGAYVPIDPEYPTERIKFMLDDTQAELLLTQSHLQEKLVETFKQCQLIALDAEPYWKESKRNLTHKYYSHDLTYVIYTSGTTGQPKGVMIEHRSIVSLIKNNTFITIGSNDTCCQLASPTFDASIFEIWMVLLHGGKLILPVSDKNEAIIQIKQLITKHAISVLFLTRALFDGLYIQDKNTFSSLKYLLVGGETLTWSLMRSLMDQSFRPQYILNCYGPTESAVFTTTYDCDALEGKIEPIGKPINTRKVYVLDRYLHPVPIGVIGELYIGGAGLARGYLNREGLSKERFIANRFATTADRAKGYTRLYKTGDLVRWLPDGNLEYIGRNDFQVKIRGYRIELGEIEQALLSVKGIQQVCVIVKQHETAVGKQDYLVAYYVADRKGKSIEVSTLSTALRSSLPEYMVPSVFVPLESMSLTVNGKLDRRALPEPVFKGTGVASNDELPHTVLEITLCELWASVLGVEQVGRQDDFFSLGGNSILAIQACHQMSEVLGTEIAVADLFKLKTIAALMGISRSKAEQIVIPMCDATQCELSYAQERLWFIEQYEQGTDAYHIPLLLALDSHVELPYVEQALQWIVERHSILRTLIKRDLSGNAYQEICEAPLEITHQIGLSVAVFKARLKEAIHEVFDLEASYPIRVVYYEVGKAKHGLKRYVLLVIHHIAFSGWSIELLMSELEAIYHGYCENTKPVLPELPIQYKDFAVWQRSYLEGKVLAEQLDYWQTCLQGIEPLALPTDYPRPARIDYRGDEVEFCLNEDASTRLRQLARAKGCTLYAVLLSGFYILLYKYTGQLTLVMGTPIANRHYAQVEKLIGFFVNSLVLLQEVKPDQTADKFIELVHQNLTEVLLHKDMPFEKLVEALKINQDPSQHPLFQVMFSVQDFDLHESRYFKQAAIDIEYHVAKFDLSVMLSEQGRCIKGAFNYATSLFKKTTIVRMVKHYEYLLTQLAENAEQAISAYPILMPKEYQKIIYEWNKTDKPYPKNKTIPALFEAQVKKTPEHVAVVYENKQLTYKALNQKSNQLARYIRKTYKQVTGSMLKADTLIALCVDRGLEMIIGILGVLKAGGAYVPIDPNYPLARIKFMLEDTQTNVLLTQSHLRGKLAKMSRQCQLITLDTQPYQKEHKHNLTHKHNAHDLAYVIYTSGTTGQPKGVMIAHHSMINLVSNQIDLLHISKNSRILQVASLSFDAMIWEIYCTLICGARLYICSEKIKQDTNTLANALKTKQISIVMLPPALLSTFELIDAPALKTLVVAGELCQEKIMRLQSQCCQIINAYGPTESTVCVSAHDYQPGDLNTNIGKALSNVTLYVVDKHQKPVPIGVIGELYIGGAGLARGYLNREELSKERFIANPFATTADKAKGYTCLYKTGDLVRWLPDGNLEYIGRNDFQVKIRGYRIELGEVAQALLSVTGIRQACVMAKQRETVVGKQDYLVAYYVTDKKGKLIEASTLDTALRLTLPEYMVPSVFIPLKAMPLTVNGKLDRKVLSNMKFKYDEKNYIAPRDKLETRLCSIWKTVLAIKRIGINDDFFCVGGNSILAIQLIYKLNKALSVQLKVIDIFTHKTIKQLAAVIRKADNAYQTIHLLNRYQKNKHSIWMVHPG